MARNQGCCQTVKLHEDNARFFLLALVMVLYMLSGACVFMFLESSNEVQERSTYYALYNEFLDKNPWINVTDLQILLHAHSIAENAGYVGDKRPRWNFPGSFYFVGTVVSTIGFGMTTPRTTPGKVFLIFYGFFGCAGTILFFNLFLERIITFLAYILRAVHEQELRRKGIKNNGKDRRDSQVSSYDDDDDSLDSWKPSVYWVMLILVMGALFVALCASAMYQPVEEWSYFESIYFCFVTFATIGFGDYVVSQKSNYPFVYLYRLGNFLFIVMGCCCIYSLFNVTSIVIKQILNWILRKLDCRRCACCRRKVKPPVRQRRNAIAPGFVSRKEKHSITVSDEDSDSCDSGSRHNSGEMISMRDFLQANKISLAMMQKQLWETAQRGAITCNANNGLDGGVGPLAILNKKLGQTDM